MELIQGLEDERAHGIVCRQPRQVGLGGDVGSHALKRCGKCGLSGVVGHCQCVSGAGQRSVLMSVLNATEIL